MSEYEDYKIYANDMRLDIDSVDILVRGLSRDGIVNETAKRLLTLVSSMKANMNDMNKVVIDSHKRWKRRE